MLPVGRGHLATGVWADRTGLGASLDYRRRFSDSLYGFASGSAWYGWSSRSIDGRVMLGVGGEF